MEKTRAVGVAAAICWAGSAAITISGFFRHPVPDTVATDATMAAWCRLNMLLLTAAAVLSVSCLIYRAHAAPRTIYKLGVEDGLRQARRQQSPDPVQLYSETGNGHGQRSPSQPR